MSLNLVLGLLIFASSLLLARFVRKRWEKRTVIFWGLFVAGLVTISFLSIGYIRLYYPPADDTIFRILYGEDVVIHERQDGKNSYIVEVLSGAEKEQFRYASQVDTQVVHKLSGWDQDPFWHIALTRTGPPTCCDRSQSPVLGGAVYAYIFPEWKVVSYQKWITPYASFDRIEEGEIKVVGPQKTLLVLPETQLQAGISRTSDLLIADLDGRLKVIARLEIQADNAANCPPLADVEPCWSYTATYEFLPDEHISYAPIRLHTTGTRIVAGELVSFEKNTQLVFVEGQYQVFGEN